MPLCAICNILSSISSQPSSTRHATMPQRSGNKRKQQCNAMLCPTTNVRVNCTVPVTNCDRTENNHQNRYVRLIKTYKKADVNYMHGRHATHQTRIYENDKEIKISLSPSLLFVVLFFNLVSVSFSLSFLFCFVIVVFLSLIFIPPLPPALL